MCEVVGGHRPPQQFQAQILLVINKGRNAKGRDMYELGHTRSVRRQDHLLLTPDTFVRAPLPGMKNATAIIHVGPAIGARFTQFTVEFEDGGVLGPATVQRFVYVLEGEVSIADRNLGPGDYAYSPGTSGAIINARTASRAAVFEKAYQQ